MSMGLTTLRTVMMMSNYKQYDTRWATLGYPRKPWYIRNCGCGEVAICNAIIEMVQQQNQTPKTIQPYMVRYAESSGNGTYHYGIPLAMAYYGLTEVYEHSTMQKLFAELSKGERIAILLMGSRNAGSKGVHWTGSGHFVCATAYKKEGGKDWLYVKDSASTSSLRNGWITYQDNIRGACLKCWSGKLMNKNTLIVDGSGGTATVKRLQHFLGVTQSGKITVSKTNHQYCEGIVAVTEGNGADATVKAMQRWLGIKQDGFWGKATSLALQKRLNITQDGYFGTNSTKSLQRYLNMRDKAVYPSDKPKTQTKQDKMCSWAKSICDSGKYHYKVYDDDPDTHECPICHPGSGQGWNCIGYAVACWRHGGGIPCRCNCEVINNSMGERMLRSSHEVATRLAKECLGITQIQVISNGGKAIPASKLQKGDLILYFEGSTYTHLAMYIGNNQITDSSRAHTPQVKYGVPYIYPDYGECKLAIRYTGK